jgi:DNA-binding PadR family transcriptional regulator
MIDKKELWSLAEETMRAFGPFYRAAMQNAIQDSGATLDNWFGLSLARASDPAPFTVGRFHALFPYTAQERFAQTLDALAQLELLERVGEDAYRLTDLGRRAVEDVYEAAQQGLEAIEPLPADEMERLNGLLHRLVEATLDAPEPAEKGAIACSRWTDPGESASGSVLTDQYLTDLLRFRDDAHLAAWKPYDVSGHAWEALTFIWRGEAGTAEELAEKLPYRGHSAEAYAEALGDLVDRGWVEKAADGYRVTEKGDALRREAEDATDRYFFAPWACLDVNEKNQLHDLLTRLKKALHELAESDAEAA